MNDSQFKLIVVGNGHAGVEAALAAARILKEHKVLLLAQNVDNTGSLSCNPSLGGVSRSVLLAEAEALSSQILLACDKSSIQTKVIGKSGGRAMWATRAQLDRQLFKMNMRKIVEAQHNLYVFQHEVVDIILQGDTVKGVKTKMGINFMAEAVILTAGTFLNGKLHVGLQNQSGGRAAEAASTYLADRLKELKLPMGRLKTGTPPRIDGRTIDFSKLHAEYGDGHETGDYAVFSMFGDKSMHPKQIPNWITHTNQKTHDIFRAAFDESPMFNKTLEDGITGNGPRYCMSLETKIDRFSDKDSHQIILEPEGLNVHTYYPNGISTSLPFHAQIEAIHSIVGLENAQITTPGYAVEYDYYHPTSFKRTLESKNIKGLFCFGAMLGLSGYAESSSGAVAVGACAALQVLGKEPFILERSEAYIGVMIDEITTKTDLFEEPYRMFSSRVEHRLSLRQDNSDRLTPRARQVGLIDDEQWAFFNRKQDAIAKLSQQLKSNWVNPKILSAEVAKAQLGVEITREYNLAELIKRPNVSYQNIEALVGTVGLDSEISSTHLIAEHGENVARQIMEQVEILAKYEGYLVRQQDEVARMSSAENTKIPADFVYEGIPGLSTEVKQKLNHYRPETLGHASRISGITSAAIAILMVYLRKNNTGQAITA